MAIGSKKKVLMKAVSELKEADYSKEPELYNIYQRLNNGRKAFADIFEKNIKAVMQISSLDLTMQYQTERIMDISENIIKATETIFGNAYESSLNGKSNNQHEELTNTILQVSSETDEVYQKIQAGQNELTTIKELSGGAINQSREMQKDMDNLFTNLYNDRKPLAEKMRPASLDDFVGHRFPIDQIFQVTEGTVYNEN